jgi:hypothetical protein
MGDEGIMRGRMTAQYIQYIRMVTHVCKCGRITKNTSRRRKRCVACFVKQFGAKPYSGESLHMSLHSPKADPRLYLHLKDGKGGDMSEWPADLRVREMPCA